MGRFFIFASRPSSTDSSHHWPSVVALQCLCIQYVQRWPLLPLNPREEGRTVATAFTWKASIDFYIHSASLFPSTPHSNTHFLFNEAKMSRHILLLLHYTWAARAGAARLLIYAMRLISPLPYLLPQQEGERKQHSWVTSLLNELSLYTSARGAVCSAANVYAIFYCAAEQRWKGSPLSFGVLWREPLGCYNTFILHQLLK